MIFQLIVGPFSTVQTLPKGMSFLLISLTAVISGTSMGITGVQVNSSSVPPSTRCISGKHRFSVYLPELILQPNVQGNQPFQVFSQAGKTRAPEIANLCISFAFTALSLLGFVWQFAWHRLEDNFDSLPWLPAEGAKEGLPCPFTGTPVL